MGFFLTGLLGVGGGFLIVPALTLVLGLPVALTVGTSLVIIVINSAAGFAAHLGRPADRLGRHGRLRGYGDGRLARRRQDRHEVIAAYVAMQALLS